MITRRLMQNILHSSRYIIQSHTIHYKLNKTRNHNHANRGVFEPNPIINDVKWEVDVRLHNIKVDVWNLERTSRHHNYTRAAI